MTQDLKDGTAQNARAGIGGRSLRAVMLGISGALILSGCSTVSGLWGDDSGSATPMPASGNALAPDGADQVVDDAEPVADLYNKGLDFMKSGSYAKATKQFEEVERQHPYSSWATRATLMSAYADYQRNAYADAILAAQRFITLHPGHKDAAYAYYLIALCYYEQIADVKRDQSATEKALAAMDEISRRFPNTAYAKDAQAKALLARDHLAGKEMEVGRYYLTQHAYVAAINRFEKVIKAYQTTSHTPEALYRLVEAYLALGISSEAQTAAAVLSHNFPGSPWYQDAYALLRQDGLEPQENKASWISQAISSVNPWGG
ncbi:outer membrane protein assembly factor BamD [Rhodoligotrophos appendicifer]|uniref:outer membrane protein assembly factor BamD n=1 Tax=Rhodoligotrophos appendicifer TaxID=987056 RepID=UPI001FEC1CEA|nr:outer membrane protein assembly factor BamD [Rhodoligotrophos appendicifer]